MSYSLLQLGGMLVEESTLSGWLYCLYCIFWVLLALCRGSWPWNGWPTGTCWTFWICWTCWGWGGIILIFGCPIGTNCCGGNCRTGPCIMTWLPLGTKWTGVGIFYLLTSLWLKPKLTFCWFWWTICGWNVFPANSWACTGPWCCCSAWFLENFLMLVFFK